MDDVKYYMSIFFRRLPWFLIAATILTAISVTVAMTLPPAYVSQMKLIVESPQIPTELASSTVQTPPQEQLQVMQQKLLTRDNLLKIARDLDVLPNLGEMNPDQIVAAMRARTSIRLAGGRNALPLMEISFEAPTARKAANVLNEYLTLIQREDAEFRRGRAGETLEFFRQEIQRLSEDLSLQSAAILEYKQANSGALPDSLAFRLNQQAILQERVSTLERDITVLEDQRARLVQLFEQTGEVRSPEVVDPPTPEEKRLLALQSQLADALAIYSAENPRVKLLQARIDQLEAKLADAAAETPAPVDEVGNASASSPSPLDIQLAQIDSQIVVLSQQKVEAETRLTALTKTIERTPEVAITLEELERRYATTQYQFQQAEDRLSKAQTGERIETRSRGQRISVIEQPAVPSQPTKPNRVLIAGGGVVFGILAGLGLIVLLEFMNNTARRPEDLVARFGITPLTTIPYVRSRGQIVFQWSIKLLLIMSILVGIPAAIYAVHTYYLPLDLLADKVMNRLGVRW